MTVRAMCGRHPSEPVDDCGFCERLIELADEGDSGACYPPGFPHPDQEAYEREIERWAP